ncbi:Outer membrane protein assembly factor YaeT precursor [hydrothermal vent metagenome]|uniref:Outer membrane protein assembly factor YaeT n=1 Tax=hydrothermal vent metagenome TaxID=652676 RepID=A0A1W1C1K2_9ZZZZ
MKSMIKGLSLSIIASSVAVAGGYKIPEQSLNSMGLGAAYVAHTSGADTNYYNPANMSFMSGEKQYVEGGVTLAYLPTIDYNLAAPLSGSSESENLPIPYFHYVSKAYGDYRWGVSLAAPGGLTKRWETPAQKAYAEEFTLKIVELNPTLSYRINDQLSIAGGLRMVYSEGVVKSNGAAMSAIIGDPRANISRDMEGDTIEFGYNVALAYRPTSDLNIALTYRSNVDLNEEGTATLSAGGATLYSGDASVSVPLPAALNVAISKTWGDTFTLEFNYERTFWSQYETLDFEYGGANIGPLTPAFDTPMPKEWVDTNTFRVGATIVMENKITAMIGFAIDETPVIPKTLGFELPDSDAKIFSMGFRYQQTEAISWGLAFLYDSKEPRSMEKGIADNPILANGGSFAGGGAYLTTVGISYEF